MHTFALTLAAALAAAGTDTLVDDDHTVAPHFLVALEAGDVDPLPLVAVHSDVEIAGVIAEVTLTQRWMNKGSRPLDATYVFPTSTRAAVHGVTMRVAGRVLTARIDEKKAARDTFERARDDGKRAALLEQQRDDVLQMSVANIQPGETIDVVVRYSELVSWKEHVYSVALPAVVGPRYLNAQTSPDDLATFTEPSAQGVQMAGAWSARLHLSSPLDIATIGSPTHALAPQFSTTSGRRDVTLALDDREDTGAGARDLVVRFVLGGGKTESGVLLFRDKAHGENYFLLVAEPAIKVDPAAPPPREVVFIVDTSGSMSGEPTEIARDAMGAILDSLGEGDRFNVLTFASGSTLYAEESVPVTDDHRRRALAFHEGAPSGGTELSSAIERALALPRASTALSRSFVIITDGYVAADREVLRTIRDHLDDANVFVFGTGDSVNRGLLDDIARVGRGEPFYALHRASAAAEVARFARLVARPVLVDVRLSFDGFDAYDLEPPALPDLFADRPIVVFGKYRDGAHGRIVIEGQTRHGAFRQVHAVEDNQETNAHRALRVLWARYRLGSLTTIEDETPARIAEATALALEHELLSRFTSFVVVDEESPRSAAADPPLDHGDGRVAFDRRTVIDFSDVTIEGELTKPEGAYVENRRRTHFPSLVESRKNFRAEMLESGAALGATPDVGTRERDRREAIEALRALGLTGSDGQVWNVFGPGGLGSGINNAVGGLRGAAMGDAGGAGGLGTRGSGRGGGGYGSGAGNVDLGGRGKGTTRITPGKVAVMGGLDKASIQRVVRRTMSQIKYCYERELAKDPSLRGRVVVRFAIGADGLVQAPVVDDETLGSSATNTCIERIFQRMRFPAPTGGSKVFVTYPFAFAPDGTSPEERAAK